MNARVLCTALSVVLVWCAAHDALSAPVGVNLSWDDCGAAGVLNKDFACSTNFGSSALVASVVLPQSVPSEIIFRISVVPHGLPLPSWWDITPTAGCRTGALSVDPYVLAASACEHYWTQGAYTALSTFLFSSFERRINVLVGIPSDSARSVDVGTEIYGMRLVITNSKSTGIDSCGGCSNAVTITLENVTVYDSDGVTFHDVAQASTRDYVTWQGSTVPTRRTSWGAIKGLYR